MSCEVKNNVGMLDRVSGRGSFGRKDLTEVYLITSLSPLFIRHQSINQISRSISNKADNAPLPKDTSNARRKRIDRDANPGCMKKGRFAKRNLIVVNARISHEDGQVSSPPRDNHPFMAGMDVPLHHGSCHYSRLASF